MSSAKELLAKRLQQNTKQHSHAQRDQSTVAKEFRKNIPLSEIISSPNQPRRGFDKAELQELANSIEEIGLLQPITVRRIHSGYELIAGERRLKAHQLLSKSTIEVIIIDVSNEDAALLTLAENLKRADLTDYEIYMGLSHLDEETKKNKSKLAKSLGLNREDMYKYLSFEKMPDYIVNDLNNDPNLIGRTVATSIKKYLADHKLECAQRSLEDAWKSFKAGKCEQTKIIPVAEKNLTPVLEKSSEQILSQIHCNNEKVGKILFKNHKLKVDLNIEDLNQNDIIVIEKFFQEFIQKKNK